MPTIVVGYLPTPEGEAALDRAVEEARLRGARLVVINSQRGGKTADYEDLAFTDEQVKTVSSRLEGAGVEHEVRGLVLGNEPFDDVVAVAEAETADRRPADDGVDGVPREDCLVVSAHFPSWRCVGALGRLCS